MGFKTSASFTSSSHSQNSSIILISEFNRKSENILATKWWNTIKRGAPNSLNSPRTSLIPYSIETGGRSATVATVDPQWIHHSSSSGSAHLQGSAPAWIQHHTNPVDRGMARVDRSGSGVGTKVGGGGSGDGCSRQSPPGHCHSPRSEGPQFFSLLRLSLWERSAICSPALLSDAPRLGRACCSLRNVFTQVCFGRISE